MGRSHGPYSRNEGAHRHQRYSHAASMGKLQHLRLVRRFTSDGLSKVCSESCT